MKRVKLKSGDVLVASEPTVVELAVGSGVAICIFDTCKKLGAVTFFDFPEYTDELDSKFQTHCATHAIPNLLRGIKLQGSDRADLVVKMLGGADFSGAEKWKGSPLGAANLTATKAMLAKFGVKISAEATGGKEAKAIQFYTSTGEIQFQKDKSVEAPVKKEEAKKHPERKTSVGPTKILIVDDSKSVRLVLKRMYNEQEDFEVVGEAEDAAHAIELRKTIKPDVISLDINMPGMNGIEYLKTYMDNDPVPTVIITEYSLDASGLVFEGLESGAFDYCKKPSMQELSAKSDEIVAKIRAAAQSKGKKRLSLIKCTKPTVVTRLEQSVLDKKLVVIGSSTGGTEALKVFFDQLPKEIPPIVVVQHIPPVFSKAFADRLNEVCPFHVQEAEEGCDVVPGSVFIAPGAQQMKVEMAGAKLKIRITDDEPVNRFKPSVDYFFQSITKIKRKDIVAIMLTGMGDDGAREMKKLRDLGAKTIGQDEETSVVFGMPGSAAKLGAIEHQLPIQDIAAKMMELISK